MPGLFLVLGTMSKKCLDSEQNRDPYTSEGRESSEFLDRVVKVNLNEEVTFEQTQRR